MVIWNHQLLSCRWGVVYLAISLIFYANLNPRKYTTLQPKNPTNGMRLKHFNIDLGAQIFLACSDTSRLRILNLI